MLMVRSNPLMDEAIASNREAALIVALLTLPRGRKTQKGLFTHLCSLSYKGDIRMSFAENPYKIHNIVTSNYDEFLKMYGPDKGYYQVDENGFLIIDDNKLSDALGKLPFGLNEYLPTSELDSYTSLTDYIEKLNKKNSIAQPLTGIMTIGPFRAAKYLAKKIGKSHEGKKS
jgi:hypothetical protein